MIYLAATIKIEIPVSVTDQTGSGVSSVQKKLSALEKAAQKVNKIMTSASGGKGIEKAFGKKHAIEVTADDNATPILSRVEDAANRVDGVSAEVELYASDNATQGIASVEDAAARVDGTAADVELGASDNASQVMDGVQDKAARYDGTSATAEMGAEDNASPVIDAVMDKASTFAGQEYSATLTLNHVGDAAAHSALSGGKTAIAGAAGAAGISFGIYDAVDEFKDFEQTMSQVKAISGATEEEFDALTAKAKQMGADTKYSATESAQAFTYMAMAGWKSGEMIAGIPGIMNLAAASGEDLAQTSDIVTDALTAFGLKASDSNHFADVMAQASSNSNTNVGIMGESFKYVAAMAGALNYSIEDTALALGLMANAGVKGSMSGTALKSSLANLAKPTDTMAEAMDKYGISLTDNEGNMKTLKGVMDDMRESLGGLSETEQTEAATAMFGKEAMTGMLAIINASEEDYNSLASAINNADGAAESMAETMMDNLAGKLELLSGEWDETQNQFGQRLAPYIASGAQALEHALPSVREKMNSVFDSIDGKISSMTGSEEWAEAGLAGKIDIAWNTLIGEPFMEWAGGDGRHMVSQGITSLFSNAAALLPGGEKAGLSSVFSSLLLAKGASGLIGTFGKLQGVLSPISGTIGKIGTAAREANGVGTFVKSIGGMIPTAAKFSLAAAAVTAAVVGISAAVDSYNQTTMNDSLEEHFGNIRLSAEEAQEMAEKILDQKYLANVEVSLNEVENADRLREEAEEALAANDVLEFKSRVGITLTAEEQAEYADNIETFVDDKIKELESRTFAAHIHVQTYLGGTEEGQTLAQNIEAWARADNLELSGLSSDLQTAVENALKDGIVDVDEEEAISALQEKINSITARWKEAEAQAQWDWINTEFGNLSAADLESGSFTELLTAMRDQRQTAMESVQADVIQWYSELNAMESSGRITHAENEHYQDLTGNVVRNQKGSEIAKSLDLGVNTLRDTYGDTISTNLQSIADNGGGAAIESLNQAAAEGSWADIISNQTLGYNRNFYSKKGGADHMAIASLYEEMKPDVSEMQSVIDQYREAGQAIPQTLMDSFNEAIDVGAAAGDSDAAWQKYANSIVESGSTALKDAVSNPDNEMYETLRRQMPEELKTAIDRAFAETTNEEYTLDGLKTAVEGEVDIDKEAWLSKIQESLGDLGTVEGEVDGDVQVKVEKGDCLSQIGEALGVDWHEIAAYNGIEEPYTIYPDMQLKIPADSINVDGAGVEEALNSFSEALSASGSQVEVTAGGVQVTLGEVEVDSQSALEQIAEAVNLTADELAQANGYSSAVEVPVGANITVPPEAITFDTSALQAATQEAASQTETAPVDVPANANITDVNTDTSQVEEQVQTDVEESISDVPADGNTDVTLEQTNNADEVFNEVSGALRTAFNTTIPVTANASITIDYSIANPSATISFGGGGSGSATVTAGFSANGRYVDGPMLSWIGEDGPEFVIPVGAKRRERGIELWQQAGKALGVAAYADGGLVGSVPEYLFSDDFGNGDTDFVPEKVEPNAPAEKSGIVVKINMNPQFNITGGSDDTRVIEIIQVHMKELADELGGEIATIISDVFENKPV